MTRRSGGFKPPASANSATRATALDRLGHHARTADTRLALGNAGTRRGCLEAEQLPEVATQSIGLRRSKFIGGNNTFDHVGQHPNPWPPTKLDRDDDATVMAS